METDKAESIASMQSAIRKTEKAVKSLQQGKSRATVAKKRLEALRVGLAALEHALDHTILPYAPHPLEEAHETLLGLLPSIERIRERVPVKSPQRTLLDRRIRALQHALAAIEELRGE